MNTSIHSRFALRLSTLSCAALLCAALVCLVGFGLTPSAHAQALRGINSEGRDFYVGMMPGIPHPASPFTNTKEQDYFLIGSYQDNNKVTITYFSGTGTPLVGKTLIINKGMCQQVPIDHASMFPTRPGEVLEYKGANIHSDFPVSVQFYSDGSSSGSMYQAVPTSALGKSYVVAAFNDNPLRNNPGSINRDSSSSEFMIIAAYNNTTVTFTPNSTTYAGIVGVNSGAGSNGSAHPKTITMMQGQIYWVRSNPQDISDDMSGSTVVSDKPVAVLGGEERALIGDPTGFWTALDNDIRDMVVEEMTPVADWGTDYPSIPTMPVTSTYASDMTVAGDGDMYRLYTNDPNGMAMDDWQQDPTYGATLYGPNSLSLYQSPAEELDNIMNPVDLVTDPKSNDALGNPKKFYAVEYQYFQGHHDWDPNRGTSHGKGVNPLSGGGGDTVQDESSGRSANEMDLVPIDRYRLSTVFMVPPNSWYRGYQFVSVITNKDSLRSIIITRNNASPGSIQSYTPVRQYQIPTHPELIGVTLKLPSGSYVITGNTPFACYSYGRTETVYKDIWGYAAPTGQAYGTLEPNQPRADITPTCGDWDVRIHEAGGKDPGIADVMLLNDPSGFYARPPHVSVNCRLVGANGTSDPTTPPFVVGDTSLEFHVQVSDPSKDAYAAIYVVDVSGNDTVIQLTYIAPKVSLTTNVVTFPDTMVGTNECTNNFVVYVGSTGNFSSIQMPPAVLKTTDSSDNFTVTSNPVLPANLKPGDSVVFTVCYTPPDSNMHTDSLQLVAGCVDTTIIVKGRGRTPIIFAHDWDFGNVTVGNTACKEIVVQNVGNWPLVLTKNYFLHLNPDYTFNGSVPVTILPGKQDTLDFCFHPAAKGPSDSRMDWGTNLPGKYAHQQKDTTQLLGYGISPGLNWDPHSQPFNVECTDTQIVRVELVNISSGPTGADLSITDLHVIGDISEFSILRTQQSPNSVPWRLLKGDSQWVDLQFAPNLNNGFGNRLARIVANGNDDASNPYTDTLNCVAFIREATVAINPQSYNFGDQTPGTQLTQPFTITNTGDTAFIFAGLNLTGPDFKILSGPKIGDTIQVGMTDTILVQFTASSGGFSTGIINVSGDHSACSIAHDTALGSSSIVRIADSTPNYPTTFICHNDSSLIRASNTGTLSATLDSVVIVDSSAFPLASSQFAFTNGSQTIVTNLPLSPLASTTFPVRYTPSSQGSVAAVAVFYWHAISKGKDTIFQDRQPITGIGYLTANHLSILNPTKTPYTAVTANQVSLPIQLKQPFDATAQVYGMIFTIRYYGDGFIYQGPVVPQAGFQLVNTPKPIPDPSNNNYELLTIQLKSNSPIVDSGVVATVNLEYVVAKDSVSPFQIEDLSFLDTNGAQACWVAEAADSTGFYGTNTCGDATLRQYLHGGMPAFSIGEVVPNPVTQSANVDFFVTQDGVPMTMQVFNALGQPVQTLMNNEPHAKGGYRVSIDASQLPSGLYTIFLSSPNYGISKQVLVTK